MRISNRAAEAEFDEPPDSGTGKFALRMDDDGELVVGERMDDQSMTAVDSRPRLSTDDIALLRSVLAWGRANGWQPGTDGTEREWSRWDDDGPVPVVSLFRPNYGDNGEDNFGDLGMRVHFFGKPSRNVSVPGTTVREAVDVLAALGVIPARFSSAYQAGHAEGFTEGADFVTETSVMNIVDHELDKLEGDAVQAQLGGRIQHLLADDHPYELRAATKEIVEAVWHVLERD